MALQAVRPSILSQNVWGTLLPKTGIVRARDVVGWSRTYNEWSHLLGTVLTHPESYSPTGDGADHGPRTPFETSAPDRHQSARTSSMRSRCLSWFCHLLSLSPASRPRFDLVGSSKLPPGMCPAQALPNTVEEENDLDMKPSTTGPVRSLLGIVSLQNGSQRVSGGEAVTSQRLPLSKRHI